MIYLFLISALHLGCEQECENINNFTDTWWQAHVSVGTVNNCYLFEKDGDYIERNEDYKWPAGTWEYERIEDCRFLITTTTEDLILLGYDDYCWDIIYKDKDLKICECDL